MAVTKGRRRSAVQEADKPEESGTDEDEEISGGGGVCGAWGGVNAEAPDMDEMSEGNAVAEEHMLIGAASGQHESDEYEEDSELDELNSGSEEEDPEALDRIRKATVSGVQKKRSRAVETLDVSSKEDPLMVGPGKRRATVSALLDALEGTEDLGGSAKRELKKLSDEGALEPNLDKIQSQRIERDVAYRRTTDVVSKWQSLVKKNREAKHLKFPMSAPPRQTPSTAQLATSYKAQNETELEIDRILKESGMLDDKEAAANEDLEMKELTKEEVAARRGELRKMKALMFYYDKKMKRIKKIKSKNYRRAHKKERMKHEEQAEKHRAENDDDYATERAIERERERAEERMSLRHKNTSKWIKRQIIRGTGKFDLGSRQAIAEQLDVGEKLKKKQRHSSILERGPEEEYDDSGEDVMVEEARKQLEKEAKKVERGPLGTAKSSLFSMKFMRKAMEKRKDEARELMGQVDGEDQDTNSSVVTGRVRFSEKQPDKNDGYVRASDDEEENVEEKLRARVDDMRSKEESNVNAEESSEVDIGLSAGAQSRKGVVTRLSGRLNIESEQITTSDLEVENTDRVKTSLIQGLSPLAQSKALLTFKPKPQAGKSADQEPKPKKKNPWLTLDEPPDKVPDKIQRNTEAVEASQKLQSSVVTASERERAVNTAKETAKRKGMELVKMAFAGAGAEVEEFRKDKEAVINIQLPKPEDAGAVVLPGWGSWEGKGVRPSKGKQKFAKQAIATYEKAKEDVIKKRKDTAPQLEHVILADKRLKRASDLLVPTVPFPFKSAKQYEASLSIPLGRDWIAPSAHRVAVQPPTETRQGMMIDPIKFGGKKGKIRDAKRKPLGI
eukprot:CAMPEP_0184746704 /NCGR_PEP_ID=MMETSP0315-20130426/9226_1 /TAXON_ID=101924 /ORGANISM="Rhodosorus marinus, Strain UTEX LB 2760" /LENGTH=842 /DNA_ID=CAMNT_0027219399 /DNA_START=93 /DNA_END=2622 /DNA_ORIENTATION=-